MKKVCFLLVLIFLLMVPEIPHAKGAHPYQPPGDKEGIDPSANTVIGASQDYIITQEDTLLDIARNFDLGYNELALAYPDIDPWFPPAGKKMSIPTAWVLPLVNKKGIVINVPELRLYFFFFLKNTRMVKTYPIGIGVLDAPTPLGSFTIIEKTKNPTWYIPLSLQAEYERTSIPPGPDNPLGAYRLRLSNYEYGIHGTNIPWGIGRLVSHGCIRLYPEDIEKLFSLVKVGTPVEIIYEPIKVGFKEGRIFVEVHTDPYNETVDLFLHAAKILFTYRIWEEVDLDLLAQAIEEQTGIPTDITKK